MTTSAKLRGLSFKKLDLHLHTPASEDFDGAVTAQDIIVQAIDRGLDGIAVTDHNSAEWIDAVKTAAEGTSITVFPGVEITCSGGKGGLHILAIFDPSVGKDHVKGLLSALEIPPSEQGKLTTIVTAKTPQQVIDTIQSDTWGGLAVLAHINSDKGVFKSMQGEQRTQLIQHPGLLAAEATDFQDADKTAKHRRAVDYLDGQDATYKRKLAVYQASDNPNPKGHGHTLETIGSRCAYFKMERINLESLRQCFCDPDVRIRQDYELRENHCPHISRVKITGGFLNKQDISFHSGLNSVLGAKGAGKSLLIELLRFVLGQPPQQAEILRDHRTKLAQRLEEYGFVEVWFVDEAGKELYVKRTFNTANGNPFDVSYDPAQVFPVLFLSQNEIIKIAESEEEQLKFIDMFFNFQIYKNRIGELERALERLDEQMAEGLRAFAEYETLQGQIDTLRTEITKLDEVLKDPVFEKFSTARRKNQALQEQSRYVQNLRSSVTNLLSRVAKDAPPVIAPDLSSDPALRRNQNETQQAQLAIDSQLKGLNTALTNNQKQIDKEIETWTGEFTQVRQEYEQLVQEKGGDYQALAAQREQRAKRLDEISQRLAVVQRKKDSTGEIAKQRDAYLDELESVYTEYTSKRREKMREIPGQLSRQVTTQYTWFI